MSCPYLNIKESIITELNKHREVQKELMARRDMLKQWADITSKDYDDVINRLKETSDFIQTLKEQL